MLDSAQRLTDDAAGLIGDAASIRVMVRLDQDRGGVARGLNLNLYAVEVSVVGILVGMRQAIKGFGVFILRV
jgi:predicted HAD superfamily phosphohydrolase